MSLFNIFNVAGSAMSAQAQRLNVVSSNIANADSSNSATGETYRAKQVVFSAVPVDAAKTPGVKVDRIVEDQSPLRQIYDPKRPDADENGYVTLPNVNVIEEMVNMMSATRSYQTNIETMNSAKTLLLKTLSIGQ